MDADRKLSNRRSFLRTAGGGIAGLTASSVALSRSSFFHSAPNQAASEPSPDKLPFAEVKPDIAWQMVTSWPATLTNLHTAATDFAQLVAELTEGRFKITVHPANTLAGTLETLPALKDGTADISHSSGHLYSDSDPIFAFLASMPFGLSQRQQNAWLYEDGALTTLNRLTAGRSNTIAFPCGGAGCQMGGWFTGSLYSEDDLNKLRMCLPGLAGGVLERLGGTKLTIPPDELLLAVQTRAVTGAAFGGPSDDTTLGLNKAPGRLRYYYPGWWGPGDTYEVRLPVSKWESLPPSYQRTLEVASKVVHLATTARYDAENAAVVESLESEVTLAAFTATILTLFNRESTALLDEIAGADPSFSAVLTNWRHFRKRTIAWHALAENKMSQHQQNAVVN